MEMDDKLERRVINRCYLIGSISTNEAISQLLTVYVKQETITLER